MFSVTVQDSLVEMKDGTVCNTIVTLQCPDTGNKLFIIKDAETFSLVETDSQRPGNGVVPKGNRHGEYVIKWPSEAVQALVNYIICYNVSQAIR